MSTTIDIKWPKKVVEPLDITWINYRLSRKQSDEHIRKWKWKTHLLDGRFICASSKNQSIVEVEEHSTYIFEWTDSGIHF